MVINGLRHNAFPRLRDLRLENVALNEERVKGLVDALLEVAAGGSPPKLCSLTLKGRDLSIESLDAFIPLFEAGAVPHLRRLELYVTSLGDYDRAWPQFFDDWTALGPQIRLKSLQLDVQLSGKTRARFLHALSDPAFLPCLRTVPRAPGNVLRKAVDARLETRQRKREALAAAGAGV